MMEEATLQALKARVAALPGGRDKEDRPLILVTVPSEIHPEFKDTLATALKYLLSTFNPSSLQNGVSVIVDGEQSGWRVTRSCFRQVIETVGKDLLASLIVLRPDAFWDKQRVENCTKTQRDSQATYIQRSRLNKFVDLIHLPDQLGGSYVYNHETWIQGRLKVEEFFKDANDAMIELDQLRQHLQNNCSLRASEVDQALNTSIEMSESSRMAVQSVLDAGKELLLQIDFETRTQRKDSEIEIISSQKPPQDIQDTIQKIGKLIESIEKKQILIDQAWVDMEKSFGDAKDLFILGEGVTKVINWILGPAEIMLNSQQKVGYDVTSAEELRREHETIELQCWNTYGHYAELLYKIDTLEVSPDSIQYKDLISQRDFMDFVCRSFATCLERRRNVLITSLRFFRLVSEYFDRTSEVFESLVMGNKIDEFDSAGRNLKELKESQINLGIVERELVKEGEKLSDMLSMPVKDALGRDVSVNYEEDIVNIRDILDATTARRNIFTDSVELQKLTLEQVTHIVAYEKDATQAIQWLDDLFQVMLKAHGHVGCNVQEIQLQKEEHQAFQETAKGTYHYGCQLLNAALTLRQNCKLPSDDNTILAIRLHNAWQRLQNVSQEQMTRLRVSAVFHRSVEEHIIQIQDLRDAISSVPQEDVSRKRARVRKFFASRERLLLEVGRMVRLGRLLKTRLREPLYIHDEMSEANKDNTIGTPSGPYSHGAVHEDNETAVESIAERLAEVTSLAEQLDMALRGAQQDCALAAPVSPSIKKIFDGTAASTSNEDWNINTKPPRIEDLKSDEEFLSASEYNAPSRSSSFHTASECRDLSPWWELSSDREDLHKEKMVLAVGLPDLPNPKTVLKPSPEVPPGKIAREVTETTHLKVQHCHTLGVSSYVLTSETVKDSKGAYESTPTRTQVIQKIEHERTTSDGGNKETIIPVVFEDSKDDILLSNMKEVSDPVMLDDNAWGKYYHHYITKQAIKTCV